MAMAEYVVAEVESVVRGCGTRAPGGIYLETPLSEDGVPMEHFLCDPPVEVPAGIPISKVGMAFVQDADGVTHVFDWVGSTYYPNVADFLEEVRRYGVSRRIGKLAEFDRLTPESRLVLIHERAIIENWTEWEQPRCPTGKHGGDDRCLCAGIWWEDVTGGEVVGNVSTVERGMPGFSYTARRRPRGVEPDYVPGIFAAFPIAGISVIRSESGEHFEAMELARASSLPVNLVSE